MSKTGPFCIYVADPWSQIGCNSLYYRVKGSRFGTRGLLRKYETARHLSYTRLKNTMFDNVQHVKIADKCEIGIKTGANIVLKLLCTTYTQDWYVSPVNLCQIAHTYVLTYILTSKHIWARFDINDWGKGVSRKLFNSDLLRDHPQLFHIPTYIMLT